MREIELEKTKDEPRAVLMPLGSNGWMPSYDRQTASYVFQKNKATIILDFGTGISRFINEMDYLLDDVEHIVGFISHYHLDHIIGLFYLPAILGSRKLELYAPGKDIYGKPARELLSELIVPPLLPRNIEQLLPDVSINDIPLEGMTIDGLDFRFRVQRKHAHPSVAVRIGNHVAYCTDTEPEYETIGFVKNVQLLMHEVWYEEKMPENSFPSSIIKEKIEFFGSQGHSSNIAVGLIAREARVGEVMTIHHNPLNSMDMVHRMTSAASMLSAVEVEPSEDGCSVDC
jgi:ribonuclease BN (tRNA processing enzyme)